MKSSSLMRTGALALLLSPLGAHAADATQMSEEQMQQMMQNMQEMQSCMDKIDESAMDAMMEEGQKLGDEVRALCAAGKRDEAQQRAVAYGKKISASPVFAQMRACGMQAQVRYAGQPDANGKVEHVCDTMK